MRGGKLFFEVEIVVMGWEGAYVENMRSLRMLCGRVDTPASRDARFGEKGWFF